MRPDFKTSEQQDAAEFLTFLMDYLHEDLNINSNRSPLKALNEAEERRREALPIQIASRLEWDRRTHNNHSQISSRFSVQYASRLKCLTCNTTSTSYGTEYCIPLEIPAKGRIDIYECLKNYTKEERFEKENNWRCPSCKKIRESTRKITITRAPEILVINLKRFHNRGAQTTKIKTWVDFPLNDLDMTPFVVPPLSSYDARLWPALLSEPLLETTPPFKYGLYGVVNHYGSGVKSGHYIALRRVSPSTWTEFNDRYVTDIDPKTVVVCLPEVPLCGHNDIPKANTIVERCRISLILLPVCHAGSVMVYTGFIGFSSVLHYSRYSAWQLGMEFLHRIVILGTAKRDACTFES